MVKDEKVMNVKEVAQYLGIHISTVYKFAQQKKIPAFKIGADWRFSKVYIDKWIEAELEKNAE